MFYCKGDPDSSSELCLRRCLAWEYSDRCNCLVDSRDFSIGQGIPLSFSSSSLIDAFIRKQWLNLIIDFTIAFVLIALECPFFAGFRSI